MKSVVILGSTGSIGENALRVIKALPERFRLVGVAAATSAERLVRQAVDFGVGHIALADESAAASVRRSASARGIEVLGGDDGVAGLAATVEADIVICALVGVSGLRPVVAAITAGCDVALATKEVLVAAGGLVMELAARHGVNILPIDSEHSALFQCMQARDINLACIRRGVSEPTDRGDSPVRRLVLTASGGPFAQHPEIDLDTVSVMDALNHPRWTMGPKVTVDSATMMNKGFEILEARWLFNVPVARIDVVVHPESIVHSMVSFKDGSTLAQLSDPDMRLAIQYALSWPERYASDLPLTDLVAQRTLTFLPPDESRFPCLRLIREAALAGGTMPAVVNAADEVAVAAFLGGRIPFPGIWRVIESVMQAHSVKACDTLPSVFEADAWARAEAERRVRDEGCCRPLTV